MQQEFPKVSDKNRPAENHSLTQTSCQDGFHVSDLGSLRGHLQQQSSSASASSVAAETTADGVSAIGLDERLRRLSIQDQLDVQPVHSLHTVFPGERITAYENATTSSLPRHAPGFKLAKQTNSASSGPSLNDCPNEILTHILSHLNPDSHGSVALVSKRFYALITEPHAWRMAFLRFFPGQDALDPTFGNPLLDARGTDRMRSEARYFSRLTCLASWRSEYLLRTRLLRSIARGKPGTSLGGIGSSSRSSKKASAVLTYNSKLPWMISSVHAVFSNEKKGPQVVHGTADMCVATTSSPSSGRVEKWGLDDPFSFAQLDEIYPHLEPYGVGDGPAAVPNVMDVSQPYGIVGGEGFPGGRVYLRATNELRGRYLGPENAIIDMSPEVPKIPELSEAVCSVWIAKSSPVPLMTQGMVGIMSGSSLGIVTTYALGHDAGGRRFKKGEMTARWALSPGVPIIAIRVDDSYNQKRKAAGRIWACALNALGECFVLTSTPSPLMDAAKDQDSTRTAWLAGRTVSWELIESTRRKAQPDEFDKNAIRGAYSPRSPSNEMNLSKEQIIAEAREMEKFLRYVPAHFRKVCEGWDMRRKLEVDFAGGETDGDGEAIFIMCCGHKKGRSAEIRRLTRRAPNQVHGEYSRLSPVPVSTAAPPGFGSRSGMLSPLPEPAPRDSGPSQSDHMADAGWGVTLYDLSSLGRAKITTAAMDQSTYALLTFAEDPLNDDVSSRHDAASTPTSKHSTGEIPGRRTRFFGVGTNSGKVLVWDARDSSGTQVKPLRLIQTDSPEITCLAISALYLVHGGSDGLVQAWDPLASSLEPIRTLSARSSGRVPRHILNANPALRAANYAACSAIFLDPNPTILRGILCFGTFVRYWTYSSTAQPLGRKRRLKHADIHGRLAGRRNGGVMSFIAAEEAELRHEQEHHRREQVRLRNRFGVGLAGLTEEEAINYAQKLSEDSYLLDGQRRASASDTGSAADVGETISSLGSLDTVTPDPSVSNFSPSPTVPAMPGPSKATRNSEDDTFEEQIQRAIRLSLMESGNGTGPSSPSNGSGDFDFPVTYKSRNSKRSTPDSASSSKAHTPVLRFAYSAIKAQNGSASFCPKMGADEELALALRLSLEEEEQRKRSLGVAGLGLESEELASLETEGKGKGIARQ